MNNFKNTKNYQSLDFYYKNVYSKKVAKIALNADFTCPNKDGKKGYGGCSYCSKLGSGDSAGDKNLSLRLQFQQIKEVMEKKWPDILYIPYLQANSNTYATLSKLKEIYEEILLIEPEKTVALAIATRPDCFSEEIYNYLEKLNQEKKVIIELGFQTSNEETGKRINRCLSNEEFCMAVLELRKRNIEVVVHIINGLPGETKKDMLDTIDYLNSLDVQGIKIHSLLILKDTKIYQDYQEKPFPILSLEEYVEICALQIARLKPSVIIHRLSADATIENLIYPEWTRKKLVVMNEIDKYMRKNHLFQGDHYIENSSS